MEIKEKIIKEPTFNTFLSSYITDLIVFMTGILSVILTFINTYMLCGQSKLKSIVANMPYNVLKQ